MDFWKALESIYDYRMENRAASRVFFTSDWSWLICCEFRSAENESIIDLVDLIVINDENEVCVINIEGKYDCGISSDVSSVWPQEYARRLAQAYESRSLDDAKMLLEEATSSQMLPFYYGIASWFEENTDLFVPGQDDRFPFYRFPF